MPVSFPDLDCVLDFDTDQPKNRLSAKTGIDWRTSSMPVFYSLPDQLSLSSFPLLILVDRKRTTQRQPGSEKGNSFVWSYVNRCPNYRVGLGGVKAVVRKNESSPKIDSADMSVTRDEYLARNLNLVEIEPTFKRVQA